MTHLSGKALRNVGHAEFGDAMATVWMVLSDRPNDRRTLVVADPEGLLRAERVEKLHHVGCDLLERIVLVMRIDARAPVSAHIRRNCYQVRALFLSGWRSSLLK
jgi:hypothetical protein